ncbi:MAG: DoxX family membrane protein [Patescibacteria group bacterium]|nr:DoxX family membrane protein [Patescibacteria group bacterium]
MLNPFPDLLVLGFFAPTLIRVAAAALFLYAGYIHWQRREAIANVSFPIVGRGEWIAWLSIVFHLAVGAMLFFGYYTQIAALLGLVGSLKGVVLGKSYAQVFVYSRATYILLAAICASLLFSGAGAFAFDLPL